MYNLEEWEEFERYSSSVWSFFVTGFELLFFVTDFFVTKIDYFSSLSQPFSVQLLLVAIGRAFSADLHQHGYH